MCCMELKYMGMIHWMCNIGLKDTHEQIKSGSYWELFAELETWFDHIMGIRVLGLVDVNQLT